MPTESSPLDLAIVGAGICGVTALHYARQAGLSALVFEKQAGVGGLWRKLPAWQDLQIGTQDWALGPLALDDPRQPAVLGNIEAWVRHFGLADGIRLACPVHTARRVGEFWELDTSGGPVRARHLLAATGAHNLPRVPDVRRQDVALTELHSSELADASELAGRRVVVVGGGASAFDLLDLALEHGAASVDWAHTQVRWMQPGRKPKQQLGSVREYARIQMSGATRAQINAGLDQDLRGRYARFGLEAVLPEGRVDLGRQQILSGRTRMIQDFASIRRHPAPVESVQGRTVKLANGDAIEADLLLWGTGYDMELGWLDHPGLSAVRGTEELAARCGGLFISRDLPDLYFPGVLLDSIGTSPWMYAMVARSLMAHVKGLVRLDTEPLGGRINHFELAEFLARRDPLHFPPATWREEHRALAATPDGQALPVPPWRGNA